METDKNAGTGSNSELIRRYATGGDMPDMERLTRKLELDLADGKDKRIIEAYHAGLDRARKEIAAIVATAAIVFVVIRVVA